ncbi:hypothetical protein D0466_18865 [Peribacillus glennii]|uniref:D-isomer specific 2-hydroxyacid dehydrogenase catalytic domain-containing protein n=2 Tax=Peribacillus glennii TaxID=2303991 RepID=A0A372L7M0_9BACI|nr:hypothetical protein D0466_18865 [Peribacillus glennii]
MEQVRNADALLCPLSAKVTKKVIESAPHSLVIANFGAGFDNIDIKAAKEKRILIANTPYVSYGGDGRTSAGVNACPLHRIPEGDISAEQPGSMGGLNQKRSVNDSFFFC